MIIQNSRMTSSQLWATYAVSTFHTYRS